MKLYPAVPIIFLFFFFFSWSELIFLCRGDCIASCFSLMSLYFFSYLHFHFVCSQGMVSSGFCKPTPTNKKPPQPQPPFFLLKKKVCLLWKERFFPGDRLKLVWRYQVKIVFMINGFSFLSFSLFFWLNTHGSCIVLDSLALPQICGWHRIVIFNKKETLTKGMMPPNLFLWLAWLFSRCWFQHVESSLWKFHALPC